jgi:single-strand DNA-binding protein
MFQKIKFCNTLSTNKLEKFTYKGQIMNILHIIGFLGADPEERTTPSGQKLWTLRVATSTKKNGQEETVWWRLTVWGDQYDKMLSFFKKGKPIYVVAEMGKLDVYTDKSGQPQVSYDATVKSIHFVPYKNDRQDQENNQQGAAAPNGYQSQQGSANNAFAESHGAANQQQYGNDFSGAGFGNNAGYQNQNYGGDDGIPF